MGKRFISCLAWVPRGASGAVNQSASTAKRDHNSDEDSPACSDNESDTNDYFAVSRFKNIQEELETGSNDSLDSADVILATDNLICVGQVESDISILEVFVYNHEDGIYVHHDLILPAYPLSLEWLNVVPDKGLPRGSHLAVGSMSPHIDIWNLDVSNTLDPFCTLGSRSKSKNKRTGLGHSEPVLGVSFNSVSESVLASASADETVILWDLQTSSLIKRIDLFSEKLQSIKFHPFEAAMLLTGGFDKTVSLIDCRTPDTLATQWGLSGVIEQIIWDSDNPFQFYCGLDDGHIASFDVRQNKPLLSWKGHAGTCSSLSLCANGCLVTGGSDGNCCVWGLQNGVEESPTLWLKKAMNMGGISSVVASPDDLFTVAVGGERESLRLWNIEELVGATWKSSIGSSAKSDRRENKSDQKGVSLDMDTSGIVQKDDVAITDEEASGYSESHAGAPHQRKEVRIQKAMQTAKKMSKSINKEKVRQSETVKTDHSDDTNVSKRKLKDTKELSVKTESTPKVPYKKNKKGKVVKSG